MIEDRPGWARRITREREARSWSQADAVRAMRAHAPEELASDSSLLRQWKRWEAGEVMPSEFYRQIIAATFGTVTHSMFPVAPQRDADSELLTAAGMDTLELVSRLQRSDVDAGDAERAAGHRRRTGLGLPVQAPGAVAHRGPGVAEADERVPGPADHPQAAPRGPGPGGLGGVAGRVRGVRHRQPARRRDHPARRAVPGRGDRPCGDSGLGARDPCLDEPHQRRLPRRHRRRPGRDRRGPAPRRGGAARRPGGQGLVADRRPAA